MAQNFFAETINNYRALVNKPNNGKIPSKESLTDFGSRAKARNNGFWQIRREKAEKSIGKKAAWLSAHSSTKAIYVGFILFFLLFSFVSIPFF